MTQPTERSQSSIRDLQRQGDVEGLARRLHGKGDACLVRVPAARALGQLRDPRATEVLAAALEDEDASVRAAAAVALAESGDPRGTQAQERQEMDSLEQARRNRKRKLRRGVVLAVIAASCVLLVAAATPWHVVTYEESDPPKLIEMTDEASGEVRWLYGVDWYREGVVFSPIWNDAPDGSNVHVEKDTAWGDAISKGKEKSLSDVHLPYLALEIMVAGIIGGIAAVLLKPGRWRRSKQAGSARASAS